MTADPTPLAQLIRRTFDEWMGSAETVEAWASRLERAIAGLGAPQPATVEEIEAIIQAHSDKPEISMSRWSRAARAPAPDPEAVELAKRLPSDAATANAIAVAWEAIKKLSGSHYITADEWSALAAAAAFVRRAAGESGV